MHKHRHYDKVAIRQVVMVLYKKCYSHSGLAGSEFSDLEIFVTSSDKWEMDRWISL